VFTATGMGADLMLFFYQFSRTKMDRSDSRQFIGWQAPDTVSSMRASSRRWMVWCYGKPFLAGPRNCLRHLRRMRQMSQMSQASQPSLAPIKARRDTASWRPLVTVIELTLGDHLFQQAPRLSGAGHYVVMHEVSRRHFAFDE